MMLAGKAGAGEGNEVRHHAGCRFGCDIQHPADGGKFGQWWSIAVRRDHGTQAIVAPGGDDQVREGADHSGHANHQGPGQGDDADQVVQIEPAQAR
ncbi:hypothetical protein D3C85_1748440 [compost metagenome]